MAPNVLWVELTQEEMEKMVFQDGDRNQKINSVEIFFYAQNKYVKASPISFMLPTADKCGWNHNLNRIREDQPIRSDSKWAVFVLFS